MDISMCTGMEDTSPCTLKNKCFRYKATPDEFSQSYGDFKQDKDGNCPDFWDLKDKHAQWWD